MKQRGSERREQSEGGRGGSSGLSLLPGPGPGLLPGRGPRFLPRCSCRRPKPPARFGPWHGSGRDPPAPVGRARRRAGPEREGRRRRSLLVRRRERNGRGRRRGRRRGRPLPPKDTKKKKKKIGKADCAAPVFHRGDRGPQGAPPPLPAKKMKTKRHTKRTGADSAAARPPPAALQRRRRHCVFQHRLWHFAMEPSPPGIPRRQVLLLRDSAQPLIFFFPREIRALLCLRMRSGRH